MHTQTPDVVALELADLNGLLTDLYRRVAGTEPAMAHSIAHMLETSATHFRCLDIGQQHQEQRVA